MCPLGQKTEHPSYGMLEVNRTQCSPGKKLFGSSMKHQQLISMTIKTASVERDLNKNWFFGNRELVRIEMSYSQFVQAIMSHNTSGTPVTITWFNGESIPEDDDFETPRDIFIKEFHEDLQELLGNAAKAAKLAEERLSSSKPMNKEERNELKNLLYKINHDIRDNISFVQRQFERQIDRTITEAKGEVEAFFNDKISSLGSAALLDHLKSTMILQLPLDKDNDQS